MGEPTSAIPTKATSSIATHTASLTPSSSIALSSSNTRSKSIPSQGTNSKETITTEGFETLPAARIAPANSPPFTALSFVWGELDDQSFCQAVAAAYNETRHWKKTLFQIPHSSAEKSFVREFNRLFRAYAESSALERIALASTAIMPVLLLQNPSTSSRTKDHSQHLERRLLLWEKGNINNLVIEGRAIQSRFPKQRPMIKRRQESIARQFADRMFHGDVSGATNLLTTKGKGGVLRASDPIGDHTVLDVLREKHPQARPATQEALIPNPPLDPVSASPHHTIIFEQITAKTIKDAALHTKGSAGRPGLTSMEKTVHLLQDRLSRSVPLPRPDGPTSLLFRGRPKPPGPPPRLPADCLR